jgi:glycosyltransferase involved in cell wall biosynthesis
MMSSDASVPRRFRVMIAHSFYRLPGGEDSYVGQQVPLLARRHDVELVARRNAELTSGIATAARMTISRPEQRRVEEAIERFAPQVVHLHNAYPAFGPAVHLAARRKRVPLVMTVHNFRLRCPNGYMFTEGAACRRCERGVYAHAVLHRCFASRSQSATYASALWVHRFVLRLQDKVELFVTPSEFVRRRLLEWGIEARRVAVVRNFTAVEPGTADPGDFGMYLGRLSGEKGVDVLLRALKAAADPPFRIVGDGPLRTALVKLAGDLGLRRTEFLGQIAPEEVPGLLRSARLLAVPSVWDENAPIAALEAMAAGRPLVVTATGGLPELIRGGEGLACAPGDAAQLAQRIRALFDDDELCVRTGERALQRARAEFSPEHHLERLEGVYDRVIAGAQAL